MNASSVSYTMPVDGSMATASCWNRPIGFSGVGFTLRRSSYGSTSKMKPWSLV